MRQRRSKGRSDGALIVECVLLLGVMCSRGWCVIDDGVVEKFNKAALAASGIEHVGGGGPSKDETEVRVDVGSKLGCVLL